MKKISDEILQKIKEGDIKPTPRWVFDAKNYLMWALFAISVIVGGLAVSSIIFILRSQDWPMGAALNAGGPRFFLIVFPYFWLIILAVFIVFAFYEIKNTRTGYKYNPILLLVVGILLSIILGSLLFIARAGEATEGMMRRGIPIYRNINHNPERVMERMRQDPNFERKFLELRNSK